MEEIENPSGWDTMRSNYVWDLRLRLVLISKVAVFGAEI